MTEDTEDTVERRRDIQEQVAMSDLEHAGEQGGSGAVQAGARRYPEPPFPEQLHAKPGIEAEIEPAPMYDAPFYKGSGKLEGSVALITGGDSGIARAVAVAALPTGQDDGGGDVVGLVAPNEVAVALAAAGLGSGLTLIAS